MSDRDEAFTRVRLMAGGSDKWDLSPNDCAALGVVLSEVDRLERERDEAAEELARHRSISVRIDGARAGEVDAERASVVLQEQASQVYQERDEARAEVARLREREQHFAMALRVADGGQYRADWDGAIQCVVRERDEARRVLRYLRDDGWLAGIHLSGCPDPEDDRCECPIPWDIERALGER